MKPPPKKSPVNMPVRMIYDLAEKARADESFWTAFVDAQAHLGDESQEGKVPAILTLIETLISDRHGKDHGYDTWTLQLMLQCFALEELGRPTLQVPSEKEVYAAVAMLRNDPEYWDYTIENWGKNRDCNRNYVSKNRRSMLRKKVSNLLGYDEDAFYTIILEDITRMASEEINNNKIGL